MAYKVTNLSGEDVDFTIRLTDGSMLSQTFRAGETIRGLNFSAYQKINQVLYGPNFPMTWDNEPIKESKEKVCWQEEGF